MKLLIFIAKILGFFSALLLFCLISYNILIFFNKINISFVLYFGIILLISLIGLLIRRMIK
jgi:nitrate reductase gamma subunit